MLLWLRLRGKLWVLTVKWFVVFSHFSHINREFSSHIESHRAGVSAHMIALWHDLFPSTPGLQTWHIPCNRGLVEHAAPRKQLHTACSTRTLWRRSMRCQFTPRNLPRLHSADKSFSFALNYPKYFPKAPGSASKSFYRQKIEAQWAEGEKGRYEGRRRGRNEQQQEVKEGDPMQCHYREWMLLHWLIQ